jgi:hypothetical protein
MKVSVYELQMADDENEGDGLQIADDENEGDVRKMNGKRLKRRKKNGKRLKRKKKS